MTPRTAGADDSTMPERGDELIAEIIAERKRVQEMLIPSIVGPLLTVPLTMGQLKALAIIVATSPEMSVQNLATDLHVSLATTSGIVERLVQHGMVERHEDAVDHRVRRLGATAAGRALVLELAATTRELTRETLAALDPDDLRALHQGMSAVFAEVARCANDQPRPTVSVPPL
ncbi:MarR family winged helix-turn-helix transcriptional regulator [Mycetocola reblochoni]|uniref:Transcriptional regulator, MarR family n=2 Tax=Mycetocola reblochoni TaxID=331618 RepID=A0A1R4I6H5_9MICO|nr:MarR family winged helix-turn-helix transcriptional regulator [Mycetocola reblochoni]RLP68209.1 MarR family transcriptional regulator [Mycetocola reblochoni]SJN15388.1 Transcriptional regulator, MarR family [Mycetocola reblochoni REB411]